MSCYTQVYSQFTVNLQSQKKKANTNHAHFLSGTYVENTCNNYIKLFFLYFHHPSTVKQRLHIITSIPYSCANSIKQQPCITMSCNSSEFCYSFSQSHDPEEFHCHTCTHQHADRDRYVTCMPQFPSYSCQPHIKSLVHSVAWSILVYKATYITGGRSRGARGRSPPTFRVGGPAPLHFCIAHFCTFESEH